MEHYTREDDGSWTLRVLGPGDTITLSTPNLRIAVDDLYARAFDDVAPP